MPNPGDIRFGRDIGKPHNACASYIWAACEGCGSERWIRFKVRTNTMDPRQRFCYKCSLRYRKIPSGEDSPHWKGSLVTPDGGRMRAHHLYPIDKCTLCGQQARDRHHKNGDTTNNTPENIMILCRRCHMKIDGRLEYQKARVLIFNKRSQAMG